jgi:hypothetical protein
VAKTKRKALRRRKNKDEQRERTIQRELNWVL